MTCYKVVWNHNGRRLSAVMNELAIGRSTDLCTEYKEGEWTVAPVKGAQIGYYLTVYEDLNSAIKLAIHAAEDFTGEKFEIWECDIGPIHPIQVPRIIVRWYLTSYDHLLRYTPAFMDEAKWPTGTIMTEQVRLKKLVDIYCYSNRLKDKWRIRNEDS